MPFSSSIGASVAMARSAADARHVPVARILSALALAPVVVGVTVAGGWWFAGLVILAAWAMAFEWEALTGTAAISAGLAIDVGAVAAAVVAALLGEPGLALGAVGLAMLARLSLALWRRRDPRWKLAGIAYVGLPAVSLVSLRGDVDFGLAAVLWVFAVVWGTDIGAFAVGKAVGGPRLSPVSPNKTWAGLAGGVVLAGLVGALLGDRLELGSAALFAGFGVACAFLGQGGDLLESWVKRRFGAKDSGALIPGHGGILDRVDGLLPVALAAALAAGLYRQGGPVWP